MSPGLRDYFAAAALQGLLTYCAGEFNDEEHAKAAYGIAGAMLAARGGPQASEAWDAYDQADMSMD